MPLWGNVIAKHIVLNNFYSVRRTFVMPLEMAEENSSVWPLESGISDITWEL